jgi:hypothetical protein
VPAYDPVMRLGEVFDLIVQQCQHEVWTRRSRGESASSIADALGVDIDTVHAWILRWAAKRDDAYQLAQPNGTLTLTFGVDSIQIDDARLHWPKQP